MANKKNWADAIFEYYVKSYAENQTARKMRKIMEHELTCGDLSHGHGIIKIYWSRPSKVAPNNKIEDHGQDS